MSNSEIANLLRAASVAYRIGGSNNFKVVAYDRAANAIENLSSEAKDVWNDGKLEQIPGVGKSIADHLHEIFQTGKSSHFKKLFHQLPSEVFELIKVPGIGPKNAIKFAEEFDLQGPKPVDKLLKYAIDGKIAKLEGFGSESEKNIINSIKEYQKMPRERLLLSKAQDLAQDVIWWLEKLDSVNEASLLGSLRRKASTVGDIDIAVSSYESKKVIDHFCKYPKAVRVLQKGKKKAAVLLAGNIQVDLLVDSPKNFGSVKQHFTGSKQHNIQIREYAMHKGWKVSDHGITKNAKLHKFTSEQKFYAFLGMQYIEPELREGAQEIKKALQNSLPKLVETKDIKGDLHIHSDFDIETSHDLGASSMREHLKKADSLGYEYIAFTEHNPSQKRHSEKSIKNLLNAKSNKIAQLRNELVKASVKKIFNSLEVDILPNGKLAIPDSALDILDFALVSIHSSFRKSKKEQTKRVIRALSHPKVKIFAHPTGRRLNKREGVELDWEKIFEFCLEENKVLEINASPQRLDLPDYLIKTAVENRVKLIISTDSHHVDHMDNMKYGVYNARRGWAQTQNILNTKSYSSFKKVFVL